MNKGFITILNHVYDANVVNIFICLSLIKVLYTSVIPSKY